jgi:UDP-N-acetylglucosamine 2-epimerase (non-hydrolysing)
MADWVESLAGLRLIEPLGYLDFLSLLGQARLLLTDSGGGQQEACVLRVPCVVLRDTLEWKELLEVGACRLGGVAPDTILAAGQHMLARPRDWANPFGEAGCAGRILDIVEQARQAPSADFSVV